jgi:DNA-binding NarL/FixJ family response regulator
MPRRIQTLGYPSRTDAVLALRREGKLVADIAQQIGIEPSTVTALYASGMRRQRVRPSSVRPGAPEGNRTVVFPGDVLARLVPHADRRRISANELARRLIEHAIDDNLIDAILDDLPQRTPEICDA